ncbi:hypothetical protein Droror1_Dr00027723, partial [Drosera rotundifolia]
SSQSAWLNDEVHYDDVLFTNFATDSDVLNQVCIKAKKTLHLCLESGFHNGCSLLWCHLFLFVV